MSLRDVISNTRAKFTLFLLSLLTLAYQACGPAPIDVPAAQDSAWESIVSTGDTLQSSMGLVDGSSTSGVNVAGTIDGVTEENGAFYVSGWACQIGSTNTPSLQVVAVNHSNKNEKVIGQFYPNLEAETSVTVACQAQGRFRFRYALSNAVRTTYAGHYIYIRGTSPKDGSIYTLSGSAVYKIQSVSVVAPSTPTAPIATPQGSLTTVFRYQRLDGGHFLTTNPAEVYGIKQFVYEGASFTLFLSAISEGYALYRCYIPSSGRHMFSTDAQCEGQKSEGTIGYVKRVPSSVAQRPLFRCFAGSVGHLMTPHAIECSNNGYTIESILGYIP